MTIKKAVSTRAALLPAIAALCVSGSVASRAETPAPATQSTPAAVESQPAAAPAAGANTAAASQPAQPTAAVATPAAPATAGSTEQPAQAPQSSAAATPPAADAQATAAQPGAVPEPQPGSATATAPAPTTPAATNEAATTPANPAAEAPKSTAALPDTASGTAPESAPAQVLPPADPVVASIRVKVSELGKKVNQEEAAALASYYGEVTGTPLWASTSGLTEKGKAVVAEIGRADSWGLPASAFDVPSTGVQNLTPEAAADTELQVAVAVLKYARYARGGRINPGSISQLMDQEPTLVPPKTVLSEIAAASQPDEYLTSLHPKHPQFHALRKMLIKLRGGEEKEEVQAEDPALAVQLPAGRLLRPGMNDPQVALLRQRLKVPAQDASSENLYDDELVQAVRDFQRDKNLTPDGLVGNGTRQVLNGGPRPVAQSNDSKIERILINMERWRWLPPDLGEFHVWDNVPEFLTRIVKNGEVIHTDEIIVGQPSWPTPVFSADMKTVVFRPSWGVPDGIKMKELAPLLRKSSGGAGFFGIFGGGYSAQAVLDAYDLRAFANGRQIDPNSINWSSVDIRRFSFQQPPGPKNVLGDVKFLFPNSHDVYMHDTPERNLFGKSFRALSHGCMRVHEPRRLAEVLLAEDKGWSASKVQSMFASGGEVALSKHIPVHITYMTARVDDNGKLQTYGDFYGLDSRTAAALTGKSIRFEQPSYSDDAVASADSGSDSQPQQQYTRRKKKQSQGPQSLADAISGLFSP
ncbi:L,D-transpeptidase YcbB [Hyphomicrobium sp. 1Nfss2.1]|uniref:L,D-transpeptidase family protein n=1 Tax=Hyphomicrobium sp. 1Nfss2.1 TaxID=3413936 RepID=UPI003C7BD824